jgi:hypothetical protein
MGVVGGIFVAPNVLCIFGIGVLFVDVLGHDMLTFISVLINTL